LHSSTQITGTGGENKMASTVEEFMSSLGPEVSDQLSTNLGIDKNAAQQMLPKIAPMILGGLLGRGR
jgi:hypothetical protein